jgi:two-component system catabolic regulation response regulator CreB
MGPRLLVVEDDAAIADAVLYALAKEGMTPIHAPTLAAARDDLGHCDVIVLDLGLPDGSGFTLLQASRRVSPPPRVVVLTSRDDEVDCVAALEAGADDYMTKPFSPRELVARVRAVLRRGGDAPRDHADAAPGLAIDEERRRAAYAGRDVPLTKIEMDLLVVLARSPGRVWTRDQLVERVWGAAYALTPRTVDSHLKGLRRKLADAGAPDGLIETVRAVGFRLREAT